MRRFDDCALGGIGKVIAERIGEVRLTTADLSLAL